MNIDHLIVLDVETTGLAEPIGVCELGMIELCPDTLSEVDRYRSLIDPQAPISAGASGIHRITNDMVAFEPTLDEYFHHVMGDRYEGRDVVVVCHNAPFDFPKIKHKMGANPVALCTLRLARKVWPDAENHKLATLKFMFNLGRRDSNSHSALDDVEDTADLLRLITVETGMTIPELLEFQRTPTIIKTMPFSKHKGMPLKDVPLSFWGWLQRQDGEGIDSDLAYSIRQIHPHLTFKEKPNV